MSVEVHCADIMRLTNYLYRELRAVVRTCCDILDFAKGEHAVYHPTEYDVLPIEEIALRSGDKELATVCIGTGICLRS